MNQYYTYILKCSDDSYYVGFTNNIERRFEEHQEGIDSKCYTYKNRPLKLVYFEVYIDVNQAIQREKQLKGWSRKKKEALINNKENDLPLLSIAYRDKK
jgi:putative endonuclease